MMIDHRTEEWALPQGDLAVIEVEVHHDGSEIVPVSYELFTRMAADLGFNKSEATA